MLDLSISYGKYEGVTFYGDHQNNKVVYYFPDEIKLASKVSKEEEYEFSLQMYYENKLVDVSSEYDLEKTSGSFLQLGVNCIVDPKRLEKAFAALRKNISSIPYDAVPTPPLWIDGNAYLITLGQSSLDEKKTSEFVKTITSTQRPSLSKDLKSVFSIQYDKFGTELIYSSIKNRQGCSVAIAYDLQFAAIRPTFDLKITAYLKRCQETVRKNIDLDLELPIKKIHLDLHTQLEWLTRKMVENGDIKVEYVSQATTDDERKEKEKLVNEFKDTILHQLFSPAIDKADSPESINALSKALDVISPVKIGFKYKFNKQAISDDRVIQVDYSERTAIIQHHNPQTLILGEGKAIAKRFDYYVKTFVIGEKWITQSVNVKLFYDFEKDDSDLECAEIIIWKHKDGMLVNTPANCFAIPEKVKPLGDFIFTAIEKVDNPNVSWVCDENDDGGYYYQLRLIYSSGIENCHTPKEIITLPILSYSKSISIIPNSYTFYKNIPLTMGNIDFNVFEKVEIVIDVEDIAGKLIVKNKRIILNEEHNESRYIVRGPDKTNLKIWVSKVFYFREKGMPVLKYPPYLMQDYAVIVDDLLIKKEISLEILGNTVSIEKLCISYSVKSAVTMPFRQTLYIHDFDNESINIMTYTPEDTISYEISKVYKDENNKRKIKKIISEEVPASHLCNIIIDVDN